MHRIILKPLAVCIAIVGVLISDSPSSAQDQCPYLPTGNASEFSPLNPAASGYGLVFDEEFNDMSHIDFSTTPNPGYNLYAANLTGCAPRPQKPKSIFSINSDGSLHDAGYEAGCGYDLASAGYLKNYQGKMGKWSNNWVGHAFGHGAFFEARFKWKPELDTGKPFAHVAFWADSVEAMFQNGALNLTSGFPHMTWVEDDFVENDGNKKAYSAGMLNWCDFPGCGLNANFHAIGNDEEHHTSPSKFSNNHISLPAGQSFDTYHVYGQLWLYGGEAGKGGKGMVINYLDGIPTGSSVYWYDNHLYNSPENNPPKGYEIFSVLDQEHLFVILGTGPSAPIDVDWIHVWQTPEAAKASGNQFIAPQPDFTGGSGHCPVH